MHAAPYSPMMYNPLHICANVILRRGNQVLLTLRGKTRFAPGLYSIISGKVEEGESIKEASLRKIYQEVGVKVRKEALDFYTLMHSYEKDGVRMSTFFITDEWEGEIANREPHKHQSVGFFSINNLPTSLVPYVAQGLQNLQNPSSHRYYQEYRWDKT